MPILMYKGVNLSGSGMSASSSLDDASEKSVATTKLTNKLNITKAPLESPVFTGTPEVPTAEGGSNSNQIANTEFVKSQIEILTKAINDATALRASLEAYGMTKVTNSSAVTDSTGLALAATEKNASIDGTLANQISKLNSDCNAVKSIIIPSEYAYKNGGFIILKAGQVKIIKMDGFDVTKINKVGETITIGTITDPEYYCHGTTVRDLFYVTSDGTRFKIRINMTSMCMIYLFITECTVDDLPKLWWNNICEELVYI